MKISIQTQRHTRIAATHSWMRFFEQYIEIPVGIGKSKTFKREKYKHCILQCTEDHTAEISVAYNHKMHTDTTYNHSSLHCVALYYFMISHQPVRLEQSTQITIHSLRTQRYASALTAQQKQYLNFCTTNVLLSLILLLAIEAFSFDSCAKKL